MFVRFASCYLALATFFACLHTTGAAELAVRPYLQVGADGAFTVMWCTEKPAYSWLEYGETPELGQKADRVVEGLRAANTTRHHVRLPLQNVQRFYYRVGWKVIDSFGAYRVDFQEPAYTETYEVRPLPGPNATVRVAILNDIHENFGLFAKLAARLDEFDYDLSIFNGDVFTDIPSEDRFIRALQTYNTGVHAWERPVIYQRGNHEYRGAFARDLRGWLSPPGDHFYGAFTAGPVRFIMLDAGEDKPDDHPAYSGLNDFSGYRKVQAEFLRQEIAGQAFLGARYRVLVHHIPLYAAGRKDAIWARLARDAWEGVLQDAPITLAICGHTHRAEICAAGSEGNPYPVAIGGGSRDEDATVMHLEADPSRLALKIFDTEGQMIQSLTIPYQLHTTPTVSSPAIPQSTRHFARYPASTPSPTMNNNSPT